MKDSPIEGITLFRSASEVRRVIEAIFVRAGVEAAELARTEAYNWLAVKQRTYSGLDYLDQIEKNAVYLSEGTIFLNAASAHYLCAGEPRLPELDVADFVFSTSCSDAQHTTPLHLSYIRFGSCSGCEVHSDHQAYSGWRDLRQSGNLGSYLKEMEFSYVHYQAMLIAAKILLGTLLINKQFAGVACWVHPTEVLQVIHERVENWADVWM